jgi:hypothetical protein
LAHSLYQLLWNYPDYLNHTAHLPNQGRNHPVSIGVYAPR